MKLFANLRRAWKRHDEKLTDIAYRTDVRLEHAKGPDERLETIDGVGKARGAPHESE
jgi:hypothetical protein